ncbi:MAG: U32 family peptidase [Clostridiales bacterium]|nr:U32 family peptidase [Clostridiales bacterium]
MKKSEILAPAGSFEALVAAVRCGANAVYIGGRGFNARRNAANFDFDEMAAAVKYCHERLCRVYLTLNTLVADSEMQKAAEAVKKAAQAGIDAFIVQDLGLAALAKAVCPGMPLHASTQMSVQSVDGVRELEKLGFCRVVLPRELSKEEIIQIRSQTDIELEYFVHGALCMCVSGQCLMSGMLGQRSGNRGLCAQPCRLPFGVNRPGGFNLSLKDLSLVEFLPEIAAPGVDSFKIEGRMKRPEYVAAAVSACKNSLNGAYTVEQKNELEAVFSRSGFTSGYYENKPGKDMFGTRRKEDVTAAGPVLKKLASLYSKETPLVGVKMRFAAKKNEPVTLECSFGEYSVTVTGSEPREAQNKALDRDSAFFSLSKCGGTQFYTKDFACKIEDGLFVPAGELNGLRRAALDKLGALPGQISEKPVFDYSPEPVSDNTGRAEKEKIYISVMSPEQLPEDITGVDRVYIPLDTDINLIKKLKDSGTQVFARIPRAVFSNGEKYYNSLLSVKKAGADGAAASTLDAVHIAKRAGLPFTAFFGSNIFNSSSCKVISSLGAGDILLSPELKTDEISKIKSPVPVGIIEYGFMPLMLTRNCPVKNALTCKECDRKSCLVDRKGVRFPVICSNGFSEILNSVPTVFFDRPVDGVDFSLLYFTTETNREVSDIIEYKKRGQKPPFDFTRGLYTRGVL